MLDKEHRAKLNRAILKIANILKDLENVPADPRAFDLLEITASLFEQQIEYNVIYEIVDEFEDCDSIQIDDDGLTQHTQNTKEYNSTGFRFLETDEENIPSVEELREQLDIPWPFNP